MNENKESSGMGVEKKVLLEKLKDYEKKGLFDSILKECEKNKELLETVSDRETAEINYILGKVYFRKGKLDLALKLSEKILEWCEKVGDVKLTLEVKNLQAVSYTAMGMYNKAEEVYNYLLNQKEVLKERYYIVMSNYANLLYFRGELNKARELFEKAYDFTLERNLSTDQVLNNLSAVLLEMGYYKRSLDLTEKIKEMKIQKGDWQGLAIALAHEAIILQNIGDSKKAWEAILTALKITEEKGFLRELAGVHSVKGLLEIRDFNYTDAVESLLKAKTILEQIKVYDILPAVLLRLSFALIQLRRYDEADRIIDYMEELSLSIKSYFLLTYSSILRSFQYYHKKKYHKAKRLVKRILKTTKSFGLYRFFAETLLLISFHLLLDNKIRLLKKALKYAMKETLELKIDHYFLIVSTSLMLFYLARGDIAKAEKVKQSLIVYEPELPDFTQDSIELLREFRHATLKLGKKEIMFKAYTKLFNILQETTGVL